MRGATLATEQDIPFKPIPFRAPEALGLGSGGMVSLLQAAGDLSLVLDREGKVVDLAVASSRLAQAGASDWKGSNLADLVNVESKAKIAELIADAAAGRAPRWRQVNHETPRGEVPISYACVASGDRLVALGRDQSQAAAAQQKLLQAQQSLERDYLRLRQAEARYRLLFDLGEEPILIVDSATRRIAEANPAAHQLLGAPAGTLVRQPVATIAEPSDGEALIAHLGAAGAGSTAPLRLVLRGGIAAEVAATVFRQDRAPYLFVRLRVQGGRVEREQGPLATAVEKLPDGIVLTDRRMTILAANAAFVEFTGGVSSDRLVGEQLANWLGRPGVDLELIAAQLREHDVARNVATIVRAANGATEEVELSAASIEGGDGPRYAFAIRVVGRRLRTQPIERDLPRSVEQLTELVGRVSLKDIVRESTDLIERLCIEAALSYTSDNRASAAEILGLSRQSLYSKLHRHGLGNLMDGDE